MAPLSNESQITIENNVLKGKKVSYPDDYTSLGEFILQTMENNLNSVGQIDIVTGEEYTYKKMKERSVKCAVWMQSQGLLPGDVIAVCSDNRLDLAMPCFAALYLGAVYSPWEATLNADTLCHQMNITKPKMIFASEGSVPALAEAVEMARLDLKIIVFGCVPGTLQFESVITEPSFDEVEKFCCTPIKNSSEVALITFSSGSTSLSKGIALSHNSLMMHFRQSNIFGMTGNICMSFSPVGWMNGIFNMLWSVLSNIPRLVTPRFEERSACAMMEKYKVSWVFLSPNMINKLLKSNVMAKYDLSSVTKVINSGTPLSAASYKAFANILPNAQILTGYGMTEFGGYVSLQSIKCKSGSSGQILDNVQLKVIYPDTGRALGPNQKGELLLKSTFMMSFYYNNPEQTAVAIDEEGWLHSGDFGYYDEDGELFVIDRVKDVIMLNDYIIIPSEIESVILSHSGVMEVAVVGQPRPHGEVFVIAFVVRAEGSFGESEKVTEKDIVDLVAAEFPDVRKQLRAGVRFIDCLPKTLTDKVRRVALRDLAIAV